MATESDSAIPGAREREERLIEQARAQAQVTQSLDAERAKLRSIGGYRILGVLGEGGMGTVYEAEQQNPRRSVALKVIRAGAFADEHYVRLFRREVQTLARLKHSCIASIYEAGCAETGQHFFAMELVRGVPLTTFAREKNLSMRARLDLFHNVCDAINYAHQRGVIHRDLKPSNVLVDAEGNAKILDFGLAKLTDADITATTVVTEVGKVQGTLRYMSPEQARGNPDEIDFRSDVYSLGVMLYELMTDQLPYDVNRAMLHEAVRVICEEPPRKPSTINRTLRGDVETIALKALEKEPSRRYQTAAAFAEDVGRYLTDQPILARRAGAMYQFRKLVARHKLPFAFIAALFGLAVGSSVWMSFLYTRADANLTRALKAESATAAEAERSRTEAQTAQRVTEFLVDLFEVVDPSEAKGNSITAHEILDKGVEKIRRQLSNEPVIQTKLMDTMGRVYTQLGLYTAARPLLENSLAVRRVLHGSQHPSVADSLHSLANLLYAQGEFKQAIALAKEGLDMRRKLLGEEHAGVADSLSSLGLFQSADGEYAAAESTLREAVRRHRDAGGEDEKGLAVALNNLGLTLRNMRRSKEAKPLFEESLRIGRKVLGDKDPDVATWINNLASVHQDLGEYDAAEPLFLESLATLRELLGDEHPSVITLVNNIGLLLQDKGEYDRAEPMLREAVAGVRRLIGPEHPNVGVALRNLGRTLTGQGRYADAVAAFRESLDILRKTFGEKHAHVGDGLMFLGDAMVRNGEAAAAEPILREAIEIQQKSLPAGDAKIAASQGALGAGLTALQRFEEAEALLLASEKTIRSTPSMSPKKKGESLQRLVALYEAWGKTEKADEYRNLLKDFEGSRVTP